MQYRKTKIVVQARTGSTRMPGKIVQPVDGNNTFLHILLSRLKYVGHAVETIVATSTAPNDDVIEKIGKDMGSPVFRGPENNVLDRFIQCAQQHDIQTIIRICSDNPFIDLERLSELIDAYSGEDYLSFEVNGKPCILTHYGFFAEIVSYNALLQIHKSAQPNCIEHVTNCIYTQPHKFNIKLIPISIPLQNIRCTLDTPQDFDVLKEIYFEWHRNVEIGNQDFHSLIEFLESKPDLLHNMKQQIKQNDK